MAALTVQQISDIIFDAWTGNPAAGFSDEFASNTNMQGMVRAQCDAIATSIVEAGIQGVKEETEGGATILPVRWQRDIFLAPADVGASLALSHVPIPGSVFVTVNGQFWTFDVDYTLADGMLHPNTALAGNDRMEVAYQYEETP